MNHPPLTRQDLTEGQEVVVHIPGYRVSDTVDVPATIEKVAVKLVTITWGDGWHEVAKFRIEDRTENRPANAPGLGMSFKTVEQAALDDREKAARRVMHDHKVDVGFSCELSVDQLEKIAKVCDPTFTPAGTVTLVSCGDSKIHVIKTLRDHIVAGDQTGGKLTLKQAKDLADAAPVELPIAAHEAGPLVDALDRFADRGVKVEIR